MRASMASSHSSSHIRILAVLHWLGRKLPKALRSRKLTLDHAHNDETVREIRCE